MAYSNTTIPKFPEYNTTANPYSVALFSYGKGEEDWYQLVFAVSASAFKASFVSMDDGNGNVLKSGMAAQNTSIVHRWVCGADGVWEAQADGDIVCMPGLSGAVYQRVWTNHNILDQSGNIWLAANSVSPVGVTESWLRSFKMGLALGLTGKPLPLAPSQKEPVAFLYNGAQLPPLPEWDREMYPYVHIYARNNLSKAFVRITSMPVYHDDILPDGYNGPEQSHIRASSDGIGLNYRYGYDGKNDWEPSDPLEVAYTAADTVSPVGVVVYTLWTNTDIYNPDGSLHLAASEPIPVYE